MKILLLAENWPPRVGGIERYLVGLATELSKTNAVTVVAPVVQDTRYKIQDTKKTREPNENLITSVHRRKFYYPILKPAWLALFVYLWLLTKREQFDVVLCGKALFEGLAGYYLKKYVGIPYIVFTYAMEIETWAGRPAQRRRLQRVIKNADRIVYINNVTRAALIHLGATEEQLVEIQPAVDPAFAQGFGGRSDPRTSAVLQMYNLTQPYILSVGRLVARKGFDVLIKAFAQLDKKKFDNVHLVIAGDGPLRKRLAQIAQEHGVADRVHLCGHVPDDDLPALYAGCEFFALVPKQIGSDIEGFGIVYLEAAVAGKAAIASRSGGAAQAVIDHQTGLAVKPDSVDAVRMALEYLLSHPDERRHFGERARARVMDDYRWENRGQLFQQVLTSIHGAQDA